MKKRPGINDIAIAVNAALTVTFAYATIACLVTRRFFQNPEVQKRIQAKFDRYL
jgi:hypothetical protein